MNLTEREAYIALNMMEGIGPISAGALIAALGAPQAIWRADRADLLKAPGIGPKLADGILRQRGALDVRQELQRAAKLGARLITRADPDYPPWLTQIHDPPLALYVMGELRASDQHALAVVGTRHASIYGRETAARLADQLARAGWTVVSGLARGIDTVAHSAALTAGGRTIAVLGGGLAHMYPAENMPLAQRIADGHGAVISEFPLDREPDRTTFPMRNRIVSGLSRGVLVVEAGRQSGALITANQALEQGRSVLAVPGRVDAPGSRGTHILIKNGARLVEDLDDILEEFEFLFPSRPTPPPDLRGSGVTRRDPPPDLRESAPPDPGGQAALADTSPELPDEERRVLAALTDGEQDMDELIRLTGIPAPRMNVLLLTMEIKRLIKMLPGRVVARTQRT